MDNEPRVILVTGGCGFIGGTYIRLLAKKYPSTLIVNIDCLTYAAHPESLNALVESDKYRHYQVDIRDCNAVSQIFNLHDPDYVVHLAAESHVDHSITGPEIFVQTNIEGTIVLLEAVRTLCSGLKRFVMVSTDEVYGSLALDDPPSSEEDILYPRSPYSASKAGAEHLALSYLETYGLPVTITRGSNNIGPWQHPEKVLPVFIIKALRGENLPVYGNGKAVRDYVHVEDHCIGIETVREFGEIGEIYNVGGDNQTDGIQLAEAVLAHIATASKIEFVTDRPGHDMRYDLSCEKIENTLGWKRSFDFNTALTHTIEWYKASKNWWDPIAP